MNSFSDFLQWEQSTRDTLDVKKIYIDMAGDLTAGIVLSELVYWYLPGKNGQSKLRVEQDGQQWIAVTRYEWWDRIRVSPRQMDRVLKTLRQKEIVITAVYRFNGLTTTHIRIDQEKFLAAFNALVKAPISNPYTPTDSPNGESGITPALIAITEITTQTSLQASDTNDKAVGIGVDTSPEGEPVVPTPEPPPPAVQPHIALIDAYWAELPGGKPIGEDYPRHVKLASKAVGEVAPDQIAQFMKELYDPATTVKAYQWWHHKIIPFEEVLKLLKPWLAEHVLAPVSTSATPRAPIVLYAETLKERMARADRVRAEWAANKEARDKLRGR